MGVQKGRVCPDSILLEAHPPGALPLPPPTALHAASFNNGAAWHQHVLHIAYTMCPPSCRVWNLFEEHDLFKISSDGFPQFRAMIHDDVVAKLSTHADGAMKQFSSSLVNRRCIQRG